MQWITVLKHASGEALVLPAQVFVMWITSLLVVRLLCFLCKALCSGFMFYNMVVVKLSCCVHEALCSVSMIFNQVVVMILCCLHNASCFCCEALLLPAQCRE